MKKITFLLLSLILSLGLSTAQVSPESSVDDNGPWYYIQVKGSNDVRFDRVMSAKLDETLGVERVYGVYKNEATSEELLDRMLWRIEDNGDETYVIVNKSTKKPMSVFNWAAQTKDIAIVDDNPTTDWTIVETDANPGYYFIRATVPQATGLFCLHQGNSTWDYGMIMETEAWGVEEDSQFCFLPNEDLDVGFMEKDFGYAYKMTSPSDESVPAELLNIRGSSALTEDITYALADETHFMWTIESWDPQQGGVLAIWFMPQATGELSTTLTVKSKTADGEIVKEVLLKGTAVDKIPVKISPTVANSSSDVWYSIHFDKRTGYYMKDKGAGEKLEIYPGLNEDEASQLWKFVAVNDTAYKLVSKLGNQLKYNVEEIVEDISVTKVGRFQAETTSDHTFAFKLRNTDGAWMIQWNEYEKEVTDEITGEVTLQKSISFINKTNNDKGFTQYYSLTDVGNSVKFYEFGKGTYKKTNFPEFSTDQKEAWYFIQFNRVIGKGLTTHAFKSSGEGQGITQSEVVDPEDASFHWKFVGAWDSFVIADAMGNEFGATVTDAQTILVPEGEGAKYTFIRYSTTNNWQLECLEDPTQSYRFINDFGGSSTSVGGWSSEDSGAELILIPLDMWGVDTGIEDMEEISDNDPVVDTVYYTLQGIQLNALPSQEGIYIRKQIHASKKVSATKVFVPRR
ncbi:MAG: RICIN domain-containing protein [Bacteroidales bacterium]|nr:RICIN domain-containing protein [Bacteroidales bacterium]